MRKASTAPEAGYFTHALSFVEGMKGRDATALAKLFSEDAEYRTSSVNVFYGRRAIESMFAGQFSQKPDMVYHVDDMIAPEEGMIEAACSSEAGGSESGTAQRLTFRFYFTESGLIDALEVSRRD